MEFGIEFENVYAVRHFGIPYKRFENIQENESVVRDGTEADSAIVFDSRAIQNPQAIQNEWNQDIRPIKIQYSPCMPKCSAADPVCHRKDLEINVDWESPPLRTCIVREIELCNVCIWQLFRTQLEKASPSPMDETPLQIAEPNRHQFFTKPSTQNMPTTQTISKCTIKLSNDIALSKCPKDLRDRESFRS